MDRTLLTRRFVHEGSLAEMGRPNLPLVTLRRTAKTAVYEWWSQPESELNESNLLEIQFVEDTLSQPNKGQPVDFPGLRRDI